MLTFDVKRKINTLRDILVGKVPDPKAQVEQITIALIYKFMDDMDIEGLEFGGTRQFFTGEYEKYAWTEIMKPENSGQQRAFLYAEGIEKMATNPNLPQLFRDIFRGAYIPYRDPDTLNMFLKEVSDFSYDNSEDLGNAFEYLLSIMGSQGDAGQFRTPRHIIDMMVEIVDPKKNETILDPACGTAGFLISAYRHILAQNKDEDGKSTLTADDRKRLTENFAGYDISPDMVRLSRVNMYLHHFTKPKISEYDTLTSEEKWDDCYDVILANPPFMTPKGGIMPHSRYRVKAKRSEVLFVDYIAEHLNPTGRAAIIVPEGIVFQSANAYKELRKYLVDGGLLYAVISLPAGVFNPYSGVKTSILLIDKSFARLKDEILFVKLNNDGFDLGAQRREIKGSEIPEIIRIVKKYHADLDLQTADDEILHHPLVTIGSKNEIAKQDYILAGDRYKEEQPISSTWPIVTLGEVCEVISGQSPEGKFYNDIAEGVPFYQGKTEFTEIYLGKPKKWTTMVTKTSSKNDIVMSVRAPVGPVNIVTEDICIGRGLAAIRCSSKIQYKYLFYVLKQMEDEIQGDNGAAFSSINRKQIEQIKIPLPPISVQEEIVAELESYQRIIDGARQVIDNYRPNIKIDSCWELKPLAQICDVRDGTHDSPKFIPDGFPLVTSKNIKNGTIVLDDVNFISKEDYDKINQRSKVDKGDILMPMIGTIGNPVIVDIEPTFAIKNVALIKFSGQEVKAKYVLFVLNSSLFAKYIEATKRGGTQHFISLKDIRSFNIPCPAVEIQESIIREIEEEISIVEQNKRLIDIFKQKLADRISEVWGNSTMYDETFKDALYGAFQPADEEYDPSFLVRLLEYFPTDKVDVGSGTYDQYLYDLEKTVVDNYEKGNYQVSFFYAHLIFMSYTYYCVDHAFQTNPDRMKDLFYPINAYNGKTDKPDIENHASVYDFSKIPEKEIFKVFRALEMEDEKIKALSKYISDRDDYAHATGQGNISIDALSQNIRTITKHMEALHEIFKGPAKNLYVQYLLSHCEMEYSDVVDGVYDFIVDNMLSLHDLEYLCHLGISGIRNENEEFKSKYRFIKKVHCTFIEYCMENMGIDSPSSYTDLRDEAYLYYKYQDNAVEYVENELGVSAYECGKEGVEFPVYECLECGAEQLAHDTKAQKYHCFSCGEDFDESTISFCSQCGAIMKDNEIDICPNCIENITAD